MAGGITISMGQMLEEYERSSCIADRDNIGYPYE